MCIIDERIAVSKEIVDKCMRDANFNYALGLKQIAWCLSDCFKNERFRFIIESGTTLPYDICNELRKTYCIDAGVYEAPDFDDSGYGDGMYEICVTKHAKNDIEAMKIVVMGFERGVCEWNYHGEIVFHHDERFFQDVFWSALKFLGCERTAHGGLRIAKRKIWNKAMHAYCLALERSLLSNQNGTIEYYN